MYFFPIIVLVRMNTICIKELVQCTQKETHSPGPTMTPHTHTHTYVDRHSKWGQHSEDTLKWWFGKLSEDKSLPLLFTSVCSPAFLSLNFRGVHASCTLIAIDGAFKFLNRIHPEFSRSFQIVTTLQKKKKITHKFCSAHSKRGWCCIGVCVV